MAAATMMPLLAQTFVDQRSNIKFEMISSATSGASGSPRHQGATPSPARKGKRPSGASSRGRERGGGATDIFSWSDATLAEKYQFVEEIGYGNWGSVWKCRPKQSPSSPSYGNSSPHQGAKHLALKLVHRSKSPTSSARVRALWQEFKCIRALRSTLHPNLIAFHTFIITPSYALVSMDHHPRLMPVALPESKAKGYFRQLLSAVEHLHVHGITHNDIKPSNVLLSAADAPVLVDFGFAQQWDLRSPDRYLSSLSWGTPEYLSPERAKGMMHDERLSDVWALGITMYEIVVGRTPFEQSEDENFLNREQLEIYYHRTTTGKFYGDYIVSSDFEALVRSMVEPSPHVRLQSCGKALRHRFFEPPTSPFSTRSGNTTTFTPTRSGMSSAKAVSLVQTPGSSGKKSPAHRRTPKNDEVKKAFTIYQDAEAPSPARTGDSHSPFSPRAAPLANRSNHSPSPATATPSHAVPTGSKIPPLTALTQKTPPPSKIPIRKTDISSPLVKSAPSSARAIGHKRFVSMPIAVVPALPSQPSPNPSPPPPEEQVEKAVDRPVSRSSSSRATRPGSVSSARRKPVPVLEDVEFKMSSLMPDDRTEDDEDEEVLASNRTSPVMMDSTSGRESSGSDSAPSTPNRSGFLKRSFSVKLSLRPGKSVEKTASPTAVVLPELPREGSVPRASSSAFASRFRKLSVPLNHLGRAPSAMTLSSLRSFKPSRRRASLADSMYSVIEAEPIDDPHSMTLPIRLAQDSTLDAEAQRARLEAFSAHVQHILDSRKVVDPFRFPSTPEVVQNVEGSKRRHVSTVAKVEETPAEVSPEPFCFNGTEAIAVDDQGQKPSPPRSAAAKQRSPPRVRSTPPRSSSNKQCSPLKDSPGRNAGTASPKAKISTPSPPKATFKPGHRRIPTAIRNVPSVVLHESADDEDMVSESDCGSRAETPFERIASPPPPPRVMEPPRQLPTWVPDDSDSDQDGDVDEPTVTLSTPNRQRKPSTLCASISHKNATPTTSTVDLHEHTLKTSPITKLEAQRVERPAFSRNNTTSCTSFRPSSPCPGSDADLPFSNLNPRRTSSRASTHISHSHTHTRSRSVMSLLFFGNRSRSRSSSRASNSNTNTNTHTSNGYDTSCSRDLAGWSTSSEAVVDGPPPPPPAGSSSSSVSKLKKAGRLRKAVSKVFQVAR
ncbi:hypothetical protein JCM5296_001722 [Sporobolomyces johnsonii]